MSRDLSVSHASVEFQLFPSHFRDGAVYLHCLAQVTNLYQHDTPLRLDNLKDPVPERGKDLYLRNFISGEISLNYLNFILFQLHPRTKVHIINYPSV